MACQLRKVVYPFLTTVVVFILSAFSASPVWGQATLENPSPGSVQSGIGVISGWACDASQIEIEFDNSANRWRAGTGTLRTDTQGVCGDTDNGFGLLYNWNLLGDGIHTVRAFADGMEFANVTVIVTTLGEEFLRGVSHTVPLTDFPTAGETRTLRWSQTQQNFVITAGSPQGGGTSGAGRHILENPPPGSFQSGVGVISGWACDAQAIEISFNGGPRFQAGSGTIRGDTAGVCGDTDNGFGLLYNWNLLGDGVHTVRAFADGVEFANVTVTVTTLGEEFARGLSHGVTIADFPVIGTDSILVWQEAQQNFVIAAALPTERLEAVTPVVTFPDGVTIPNVAVRSLYAETAEVLARPQLSLLYATDPQGTVLLGFANTNGGLQGERPGVVEVSVDSTAIVLVALSAGYSVHAIDQSVVDAIRTHPTYQALVSAMSARLAIDKNFLEHLADYTDIRTHLQAVAGDIANTTQHTSSLLQGVTQTQESASVGNVAIQGQAAGLSADDTDADLRRRLIVANFAAAVANALLPTEAIQRTLQVIMTRQTYEPTYSSCVSERIRQRTTAGGPRSLSPRELLALANHADPTIPVTILRGIAGALQDTEALIECAAPPPQSARAARIHLQRPEYERQDSSDPVQQFGDWAQGFYERIRRHRNQALVGSAIVGVSLAAGAPAWVVAGGVLIVLDAAFDILNEAEAQEIDLTAGDSNLGRGAECRNCVAGGGDYDYCTSGGRYELAGCVPHLNEDLAPRCEALGMDYRWILATESPEGCAIFD